MTLRTDSAFFVAKVTQLGFYVATGATENLHKKITWFNQPYIASRMPAS